ncbi:ABC transporter permease [Pseudonocardia dioxanivorans]|uniref:ABC transporter permease n=1 Tax=Pseudonocardia dioxanivorans TaxID=240495 RepID=UPI000CD24242|nr:ABC transporter permease subunit [Pseudonocardia dioxanivorans]
MSAGVQVPVAPGVAPDAPPRRRRRRVNLPGLALVVALAVLWEVLVRTVLRAFDNLAPTTEIIRSFGELVARGDLAAQIGHTVAVTLIGWVVSTVVGVVLGVWLGLSGVAWRWSMASVEVLRSLPSIAFVPVAILVFGFSEQMELVLIMYVCLWPVLIATIEGVRGVGPGLLDSARTLNLGRLRTWRCVVLPAAVPRLLVGVRLALALAVALAVIAEMLGNPAGLGFGIVFAQRGFQPGQVFAYLFTIGIVGWALNALFTAAVRMFAPRFAGSL